MFVVLPWIRSEILATVFGRVEEICSRDLIWKESNWHSRNIYSAIRVNIYIKVLNVETEILA